MPAALAGLQLTSLCLEGNTTLTDLQLLRQLSSVEELGLELCGLTSVPAELAQMPRLDALCLAGNRFEAEGILAVLQQLTRLRALGLERCNLWGRLPSEVVGLSGLQLLNLRGNTALRLDDDDIREDLPLMMGLVELGLEGVNVSDVSIDYWVSLGQERPNFRVNLVE